MVDFLGKYSDDYEEIILMEEYKIIKIYAAYNIKHNRKCILKVFSKEEMEKEDFDFWLENIRREEQLTKICKSKNVIELYKKFETNGYYIFEFEYYDESLYEILNKSGGIQDEKNNKFLRQIIIDIANALKIMNEHGIIHRNINLNNIFINYSDNNEYFIKLGNFSSSIFIQDNISDSTRCIYYAAPEIIQNLEYNEKCDLWSLGVSLYELYFRIPPYQTNLSFNLYDIMDFIFDEKLLLLKSNIISFDILLNRLLQKDPKERMSFEEFFEFVFDENFLINDQAFLQSKPKYVKLYNNILKSKEPILPHFEMYEGDYRYKERIMSAVKNDLFPDISKLPNIFINEGKVEEVFNNIIYFNDNIKVDEDIDYFERITPGAFIPCKNLVSLEMIKREILHYIKTTKKTIFNLIIAGNAFEKIMIYLNSNNDFKKYINKVCIFSTNLDKWLYLKNKYNDIISGFSNNKSGIKDFIQNFSSKDIRPYPVKKLITYNDYTNRYRIIHEKISEFYGINSIEKYREIKDKKIKSIKNEEIKNILKKKENSKLSEYIRFNIHSDITYTEELIAQNKMKILMKPYYRYNKECTYEEVNYVTSRMMTYIDCSNFYPFYGKDKAILRRGVKMPYSNLLPYIRAIGKIITFISFVLTREKESTAKNNSGRYKSKEQYRTCKIFSVIFNIINNCHKNWIPNCFRLQEKLENNEEDVIFRPFTFFFVKKVDIDINNYTADIYLETIGKTEILEEKIKLGKSIIYNEKEKIMEVVN